MKKDARIFSELKKGDIILWIWKDSKKDIKVIRVGYIDKYQICLEGYGGRIPMTPDQWGKYRRQLSNSELVSDPEWFCQDRFRYLWESTGGGKRINDDFSETYLDLMRLEKKFCYVNSQRLKSRR